MVGNSLQPKNWDGCETRIGERDPMIKALSTLLLILALAGCSTAGSVVRGAAGFAAGAVEVITSPL